MKRMEPNATIRPTPEAKGYLDLLKEQGLFDRMIDPYMFAAAYAIKQNVDISEVSLKGQQDLINIGIVDEEVRLALEAGIHGLCKRNGKPEPKDDREVLEILTKYAEGGLKLLKQRWEGKVPNQIQNDIWRIIREETMGGI